MKYLGWIVAACLLVGLIGAQGGDPKKDTGLTWEELKRQQNAERADFLTGQKETLQKVLDEQKSETNSFKPDGNVNGQGLDLRNRFSDERKAIMKEQADERAKEAKVWADERTAFRN